MRIRSVLQRLAARVASQGPSLPEPPAPVAAASPPPPDFEAGERAAQVPPPPRLAPSSAPGVFATVPSVDPSWRLAFEKVERVRLDLDALREGFSPIARASEDAFLCVNAMTLLMRSDGRSTPALSDRFYFPLHEDEERLHRLAAASVNAAALSLRRSEGVLRAALARIGPDDAATALEAGGLAANLRRILEHPAYATLREHAPLREAVEGLHQTLASAARFPLDSVERSAFLVGDLGMAAAAARLQEAEGTFHPIAHHEVPPRRRAAEYALLLACRVQSIPAMLTSARAILESANVFEEVVARGNQREAGLSRITFREELEAAVRDRVMPLAPEVRREILAALSYPPPLRDPATSDPQHWIRFGRRLFDPVFLAEAERVHVEISPHLEVIRGFARAAPDGEVRRLGPDARAALRQAEARLLEAITPIYRDVRWRDGLRDHLVTLLRLSPYSAAVTAALAASVHVDPRVDAQHLPGAMRSALEHAVTKWDELVLVAVHQIVADPTRDALGEHGHAYDDRILLGSPEMIRDDGSAAAVVSHELAHFVERFSSTEFRAAVRSWQATRADPGQEHKLRALAEGKAPVIVLTGRFADSYTGRRTPISTEVVTQAEQAQSLVAQAAAFACDPEQMLLIAGAVAARRLGS